MSLVIAGRFTGRHTTEKKVKEVIPGSIKANQLKGWDAKLWI